MENIIIKELYHPSEEGTEITIISPIYNSHRSELEEIFDMKQIKMLCKNQGEKDWINDLTFGVNTMQINKIISISTKSTYLYDLITQIQDRLYIISNRTKTSLQLQEFLSQSTIIITEYNYYDLMGVAVSIKTILQNFITNKSDKIQL